MARETDNTNNFWLRLDNAAKIYPAVRDRELTAVFRVAAQLKTRIKAKQFLEAVHAIDDQFPYFKVKLKAGVFWYYLEPAGIPVIAQPDVGTPCRAFGKGELLFRVLARERMMSVEFSHILTDATGALEFLKCLLLVYFEKCGRSLPADPAFHQAGGGTGAEVYEDAYKRYFARINSRPPKRRGAFHLPFRLKKRPRFGLLTAVAPVASVKKEAKKHEVSLTEYLVAVYLFALQRIHSRQSAIVKKAAKKIIRVEVPINLRRMFPSRTMRNFSLYVMPGLDLRLGHYSFDEIIKTVYHQMQLETDKKLIRKMISRNVSGEKNPLVRSLPLFIKSLILSRLYTQGTKQYSGVVTNLGKIDLGERINNLIDRFIFVPPPPNQVLKVNCAIAGFDNHLVVSFGNISQSRELERCFLTFLTAAGIPVSIQDPYN